MAASDRRIGYDCNGLLFNSIDLLRLYENCRVTESYTTTRIDGIKDIDEYHRPTKRKFELEITVVPEPGDPLSALDNGILNPDGYAFSLMRYDGGGEFTGYFNYDNRNVTVEEGVQKVTYHFLPSGYDVPVWGG